MELFKGTELPLSELTAWILEQYKKYTVTEIRYFGSRVFGSPRPDSDIDVYILFSGKSPTDRPIYSKQYKGFVIEFHAFIDFHDGYVPTYLIGTAKNELSPTPVKQ